MIFKSKIEEISIRSQSLERFSKDLNLISEAIGKGAAVSWKGYNGARLSRDLQDILVEREFSFYAGQAFYAGTGVKCIPSEKPNSNSNPAETDNQNNQPNITNEEDSDSQNLKGTPPADTADKKTTLPNLLPAELFLLPWVPEPIPLTSALEIDWDKDQRSSRNEEILQMYKLQYASHPGRTRKTESVPDGPITKEESDSQIILESFGKISGWCGHNWKYFPVFFVLAFLNLQKSELWLLKKALTPGSRGYKKVMEDELKTKSEKLQSLCQKISRLAKQENLGENQSPNAPSAKTKAQLMREYIAMSAFVGLICKYQDDAIENLLLLDYLTGLCTALLGCETMKNVVDLWKNSESKQIHKNDAFDDILRKIERTMLCDDDYREDNIINKIFSQKNSYYSDNIPKVKKEYDTIKRNPNYTVDEKLHQLVITQFDKIYYFSTPLRSARFNISPPPILNIKKKRVFDVYFKVRTIFSRNESESTNFDKIFDKIIDEFIKDLVDIDNTPFPSAPGDPETDLHFDEGDPLADAYTDGPVSPLSEEEEKEFQHYTTLRSIWIKFFLVRRMQNGEPPSILYYLGDPKKTNLEHMEDEQQRLSRKERRSSSETAYLKTLDDMLQKAEDHPEYKDYLNQYFVNPDFQVLAEQMLPDIARHYPPELWPYPETAFSLKVIRDNLKTPNRSSSERGKSK